MMRIIQLSLLFVLFNIADPIRAHIAAWTKGMYCQNGLSHTDQPNADFPMVPLYNETQANWFMHGECINYPPPEGEFLDIPAGGSFTVELAPSRAFTTLSYDGRKATDWPDGKEHPANYSIHNLGGEHLSSSGCLSSPNLHCHGEYDAAGTAFAIAYKSDIHDVTMDDLVVFSVAPNTPFRRIAKYDVPANMPACPPGGCICAWGWVPNGCGLSNIYMLGYKCNVTGSKLDAPALAKPQAPVWCDGAPETCVQGAKKMIIWHQKDGNTVTVPKIIEDGGGWATPRYDSVMGFKPGRQDDIFVDAVVGKSLPPPVVPVPAPCNHTTGQRREERAARNARRLSRLH